MNELFQKVLIALVCMIALCSGNCDAFSMSQPQEIGEVGFDMRKGCLIFKGATRSNGQMAVFGSGQDSLYVYDKGNARIRVGSSDRQNTIETMAFSTLYKINTDTNITMFLFYKCISLGSDYVLVGKLGDGKFVRFFDTESLTKQYFPMLARGTYVIYKNCRVVGDTISVDAFIYQGGTNNFPGQRECTFRFRWDDSKSWFGIEQVY